MIAHKHDITRMNTSAIIRGLAAENNELSKRAYEFVVGYYRTIGVCNFVVRVSIGSGLFHMFDVFRILPGTKIITDVYDNILVDTSGCKHCVIDYIGVVIDPDCTTILSADSTKYYLTDIFPHIAKELSQSIIQYAKEYDIPVLTVEKVQFPSYYEYKEKYGRV